MALQNRTMARRCRPKLVLFLLAALLLLSLAASLLAGTTRLSLQEVLRALSDGDTKNAALRIFLYARLPRVLGGLMCGSGLAVVGAILQVVLNNSLAGPNIIGVNAGAGFAALLVMALFPERAALVPAAAFLGALACALLVYSIARATGASRMTLVLAGVAVGCIINAASSTLKVLFPEIINTYSGFSIGTLNGVTLRQLGASAPYLLLGILAALLLGGSMDILALGDEMARALGLRAERCRLLLILTAAVLAGASVSIAGLISFVGLLVPHIARSFLGSENRLVIIGSALLGASSVLLCDLLGRVLFAPFEISVGIILSLLGGICFIILLLRRKGGKLYA